jgi:hypothetical protein
MSTIGMSICRYPQLGCAVARAHGRTTTTPVSSSPSPFSNGGPRGRSNPRYILDKLIDGMNQPRAGVCTVCRYNSTYSSWLNQVEFCFARIEGR